MGYLDNTSVIVDAILTKKGRELLSRQDGSFNVTQFALADDEINYSLYDKNNASGSAYYDLQILQTPVLEAFTNNASSMKSKLLSISRKDLLYLPMMVAWTNSDFAEFGSGDEATYVVAVDKTTMDQINSGAGSTLPDGVQDGNIVGNSSHGIRVDQGLDTTEISNLLPLDPDLRETQYLVEVDNRLGQLYTPLATPAGSPATVSFIDDDQIATYYFTENTDTAFVKNLGADEQSNIDGPRGTLISFRIGSSMSLKTNTYFFDTLGSAGSTVIGDMDGSTAGQTYRFIDTIVSITGVTTGYRVDLPVRYVKLD